MAGIKATHGVVPFFNDDQPLVNKLCAIINKLDHAGRAELTGEEEALVLRINKAALAQEENDNA